MFPEENKLCGDHSQDFAEINRMDTFCGPKSHIAIFFLPAHLFIWLPDKLKRKSCYSELSVTCLRFLGICGFFLWINTKDETAVH